MRFSLRTSRRRLRLLAVGLAVAAIAAPAAHGTLSPYSADGPRSGGAELAPYSIDGPRSGPATTLPGFAVDGPRSGPATVDLPTAAPVPRPGFDWADAGIGIAIGLGVGLVLAAGALLVGRQHGRLAGV